MITSLNKCFHVFVFGQAKSGKTTLVNRIIDGRFTRKTNPTTQCNFFRKDSKTSNGASCTIKYWDTIGVRTNDSSNSSNIEFYKYADIAIICVSVTSRESLLNLGDWICFIKESTSSNCKIVIVLTKIDNTRWEFSLEELEDVLKACHTTRFAHVSSESGKGISELEEDILRIVERIDAKNQKLNKYNGRFSLSVSTLSCTKHLEIKNGCCS